MKLRQCLHLAVGMAAASFGILFSSHGAWSQGPRTIKIVIAVPAAGPGDATAHIFADQMSDALTRSHGPMLEIETRTAADGSIGTATVAQAPPDGNTLLLTTNAFVINPYLRRVGYDPLSSFAPVCYLTSSPEVVVVNGSSPYRMLAEFLNASRAKPGELSMASFGPAGSSHIAVEMLKLEAKVNIRYVPFPTQVLAVNALSGQDVTLALTTYKSVIDLLKDGKLRALATTSRTRIEPLPDVPTVAESGLPDYEAEVRLWLLAPAATPKQTISQLAGLFTAAMQSPDVKPKLIAQQLYPVGICGDDFAALLRKQYDDIGRVIREANIK